MRIIASYLNLLNHTSIGRQASLRMFSSSLEEFKINCVCYNIEKLVNS